MALRLPVSAFLTVLIVMSAASGVTSDVAAAPLTRAACEADYQELLASIERNRMAAIDQINEHLVGVIDEKERARLIEMREKSWDEEEEQRGMAASIRRDCLAAVK